MKFLIVFVLALATTSAFRINGQEKNSVVDGRIINGERAYLGQLPYQVGLTVKISSTSSSSSGGSLIAPNWVLTAAHCVDFPMQSIIIRYGSIQRTSGGVTVVIDDLSQIIIHPGWNPQLILNDIALIRTPTVATSATIAPVKLPSISKTYSTYAGEVGIASGFGKTTDISGASEYLLWASLELIDNSVCQRTFGTLVTSSNICAAHTAGSSTCTGDSGGPIVVGDVQVGLTSFGAAKCEANEPEAFTRVTSYLEWIQEVTGVNYLDIDDVKKNNANFVLNISLNTK